MKALLLVAALLMIGKCAQSEKDSPRTYIIYGQSNSVSPSQTSYGKPGDRMAPASENLTINDYYFEHSDPLPGQTLRGLVMIKPTQTSPVKGGIVWMYLADICGCDMTVYSLGVGNASSDRLLKPDYLDELLLRVFKSPHADYLLYVQGESDSNEHFSTEDTYRNIEQMVRLTERINPSLKWVLAVNGYRSENTRAAHEMLIQNKVVLRGPDVDILRTNANFIEPTGAEFAGEGLKEHARLWYEALQKLQRKKL